MPVRIKREDPDVVESMEIDDEVVREIDVHVSPAIADQLYLLQYPLQHTEVTPPTAARIKPKHGMLELVQPLPDSIERQGEYETMAERIFHSQTIPVQTHLCLGKLKEDSQGSTSMHLVPLTHVSQMRPSLRHVKSDKSAQEENVSEPEMDEDKTVEKKPVVFHRKETERAAMARKSSYAYKKASEEAEEWQNLTVHQRGSKEHDRILRKVVSGTSKRHILAADGGPDPNLAYIESLNYMPTNPNTVKVAGKDSSSVVARLTALMIRGWPMPYSILRAQFKDVTDAALFQAFSVCAVLVRGNFLLNSKFMTLSKELQRARTVLLYILNRDGFVQRSRLERILPGQVEVPSEQWLALLQQVAKRADGGWTLKVEEDLDFLNRFPDQAELNKDYWERQRQRCSYEISLYDDANIE